MKDDNFSGIIPAIKRSRIENTLSPTELRPSDERKITPLAFFTGKVQRKFGTVTKLETVNLSEYITESTVKSVNDDLTLNYKDAYLIINTDKAQGIVGFTKNAPKDFQDITIECGNEYASILAVSLDNRELKSSERILFQFMTEETPLNYKTKIIKEARNPGGSTDHDKEMIEKNKL